jgi:hypothetical protein
MAPMTERFRRKSPARTTPIRNWSGLYKSPRLAPNGSDPQNAATEAELTSNAAQAVNAGYHVVQKHLADGRRAAEQLRGLFKPGQSHASADLGGIIEKLIRQSSELLMLWFEVLEVMARSQSHNRAEQSNVGSADTSHTGVTTARPVNAIQVECSMPVEVILDLGQPLDGVPLRSLGLHALEEDRPPIRDVAFVATANGRRPTLRIRVPDGQPRGVYCGVVVDDSGEPAGTVRLRVRG